MELKDNIKKAVGIETIDVAQSTGSSSQVVQINRQFTNNSQFTIVNYIAGTFFYIENNKINVEVIGTLKFEKANDEDKNKVTAQFIKDLRHLTIGKKK